MKAHHVDSHVLRSWASEELPNNRHMDWTAKVKVSQVDLDWQHNGELFLTQWAHCTSGHQGRDAIHRWGRARGVGLTMVTISHAIHDCEMCCCQAGQAGKASVVGGLMVELKM